MAPTENAEKTKSITPGDSNPWQSITLEELAKHADVDNDDAWMAIKVSEHTYVSFHPEGIVYDVATYAAKHPGGAEKIKKYAGKDATDTFNMVHSYVDFEEILDGYRIGVLKGDPNAPKRTVCTKLRENEICCFGTRYKHPTTYFRQDSIVGTYIVMFHHPGSESDWTVGITDKQILHVFKYLDKRKAWLSLYELPEPILNDALTIDFKNKFENIEITLRKPIPATVWASQTHGIKENGRFVSIHQGHSRFDAWIVTKKCLTHNTLLFGIQLVSSARVGVPIGYHVDLFIGDKSRPYTPVCEGADIAAPPKTNKHQHQHPRDETTPCILYFMIKIYATGGFSQQLDGLELDDGSEEAVLKVSTPHGYFPMEFLQDFSLLLLIAGGTGLAPMVRIVQHFTNLRERMRGKRVGLLYFCEKIHDLIWKKEFIEIQENCSWFYYFPVLTKPSDACKWEGLKGRIDSHMVQSSIAKITLDKRGVQKAIICGSAGFNKSSVDSLMGIILSENIFVFD